MKDGIGREMARQFGLRFRLPRKSQGSFTCRKPATWALRRKACYGFFRPKNSTASAGFEPAILGTRECKSESIEQNIRQQVLCRYASQKKAVGEPRGNAEGADVVHLNHQEGGPCGGTNSRVATLTVIRLSPHVKLILKSIGLK
jgi:hypothetical protein